jgi:hypothetical protein
MLAVSIPVLLLFASVERKLVAAASIFLKNCCGGRTDIRFARKLFCEGLRRFHDLADLG